MSPDRQGRLVGRCDGAAATITTVLVAASALLVVLGATPDAAAAEQHGFALFEWCRVNAKVSDQSLGSLRTDGFKTVHADVGEHLEVADQPTSKAQKTRLAQLKRDRKRFVARASTLGYLVYAVAGGPDWTDTARRYLGPKLVQRIADYNATVAANERLQGVQLDIEPYVDPSFFDDVEASLQDHLSTLEGIVDGYRQVRTQAGSGGLRLGFAIPFWFDGTPEAPTVRFGPDNKCQPAAFHLIDMLRDLPDAYVLVMAYRNFAVGPDGSIEHVRSEFIYARDAGAACGIVVGEEFGKAYQEKLSFWWAGRAVFRQAAEEIARDYGGPGRRCATFGREDGCRDATSRGPASSAGIAAAAASTAGSRSRSTDMAA